MVKQKRLVEDDNSQRSDGWGLFISEVITRLSLLRSGRLAFPALETNFTSRHTMRSDILAIGFALCFVSNQANSPFFSGTDVSNEFRDVLWNGHMFFCSYTPFD